VSQLVEELEQLGHRVVLLAPAEQQRVRRRVALPENCAPKFVDLDLKIFKSKFLRGLGRNFKPWGNMPSNSSSSSVVDCCFHRM
jgi:hypothetical protein